MFLTPLNKLRKTSTKLWCCARSCEGRYDYAVVTGKEVITNKPHVVLKTLQSSSAQQPFQMPMMYMMPQMQAQSPEDSLPYEEGYEDDDLQGTGED